MRPNHPEPVCEENRQNHGKSGIACMSEVNRGGVCVRVRTDSPATPLPKQLTAITSLSYQHKLLTEGGWVMVVFPFLAQD